jgi:hypothetical protein
MGRSLKLALLFLLTIVTLSSAANKDRRLFFTMEFTGQKLDGNGIFGDTAYVYRRNLVVFVHESFNIENKADGTKLGYGWNNRWLQGIKFQVGYRLWRNFAMAVSYCQKFKRRSGSDFIDPDTEGQSSIKTEFEEYMINMSAIYYPIRPFFIEAGVENIFIHDKTIITFVSRTDSVGIYKFDNYNYNYGPFVGVGLESRIWRNINLLAEFSYSFTDCDIYDSPQLLSDVGYSGILIGRLKLNVHGPRVSAGLRYYL